MHFQVLFIAGSFTECSNGKIIKGIKATSLKRMGRRQCLHRDKKSPIIKPLHILKSRQAILCKIFNDYEDG